MHEDWSMAPDDDRVRFSLSGVAPHSWKNSMWGGRDGDIQKGWISLSWASLWMVEEPGEANPSQTLWSQTGPKLPPNLPHTPRCLSWSPARFGGCSPPRAGQGIFSSRPSALTQCTTSRPPLRAGWRSSGRRTCTTEGRGLHPHPQPPDPTEPPGTPTPTPVLTWRGSSSA